MKHPLWIIGFLWIWLILTGCVTQEKQPNPVNRAAIDGRADRVFADAVLIKPSPITATNADAWRLAPLFVQEIFSTNTPEVTLTNVDFSESEVTVNGRPHEQFHFAWRQRPDAPIHHLQITLDTNGLPAIEEVTREDSRIKLFFVSQNLEAAAVRIFGKPLAGRHFALERNLADAPSTAVVREFNDSPVAMGPIIHLDASGNVTTVICRCMSTQAKELVGVGIYQLRPMSDQPEHAKISKLNESLRLPGNF